MSSARENAGIGASVGAIARGRCRWKGKRCNGKGKVQNHLNLSANVAAGFERSASENENKGHHIHEIKGHKIMDTFYGKHQVTLYNSWNCL